MPRFEEINDASWSEKSIPDEIGIEMSKIDIKDFIFGLELRVVDEHLKSRDYNSKLLKSLLENVKFEKFKL